MEIWPLAMDSSVLNHTQARSFVEVGAGVFVMGECGKFRPNYKMRYKQCLLLPKQK